MKGARAILLAGVAALTLALPAFGEPGDFAAALSAVEAGDPARGVAIFTRLAEAGDAPAQLNLAVLTARGMGIPQNDLDAAYWAWRARLAGLSAAVAASDALLARLAPDAVEALQARLVADMDAMADAGADWAYLALARLALQLTPEADPARAYGYATLAAALSVPGGAALREALARDLDPAERLAAQAEATARFARICQGGARAACIAAGSPDS